ncbi:hypothetical protein [Fredinandcohnia sp. 179-A 10B2 NHS]|uniref:hypothetical protein n=1 Tax=Fredinandcohnia sp. 179-A 10B2 NHS TaxID=3235176 RepID=UPI0039A3F837
MKISQSFFKMTGFLLIIGSLISAVGHLLKPQEPTTKSGIEQFISQALLSDTLLIIGIPFVILGLSGIYLRQSEGLRLWGWIGYPITGLGLIYVDIIQPVIRLVAYPWVLQGAGTKEEIFEAVTTIYDQDPFGYLFPLVLLSLIGPLLSALSFWKAKILPTWLAVMLALILPLFLIAPMFGFYNFPAYLYVVFGIFGVTLLKKNGKTS